jgi:hypothetical protein
MVLPFRARICTVVPLLFAAEATKYIRHRCASRKSEAAVSETRFDSFGEPVSYDERRVAAPQGAAGRFLARAGTGIFWALVAAILVARAFYFEPDLAAKFAQVAGLSWAVRTLLGV